MMPFPARGCIGQRVLFDKLPEQSWEPRQGVVRAEALCSTAGAFTYQEHLAGDRFGIVQAGIAAQPDEPLRGAPVRPIAGQRQAFSGPSAGATSG